MFDGSVEERSPTAAAGRAGERIVMIGLDAMDPELARRWAASGELPVLARLFGEAAACPVENPYGLFVGALWVNFASASGPARHGFHCWNEIAPDSYEIRLRSPMPERYESFWKRLGDAGLRVAAIDVPHSRAPTELNGIEIVEWGCHDRHFGLHSQPPAVARELVEAHGLHPILGFDAYAERDFAADDKTHRAGLYRTPDEERTLTDAIVAGVAAKGDLVETLMGREKWDFFLAVFGEAHAIGHQQWHLHDPAHPRFAAAARAAVGRDPVLAVYRAIDDALGSIIEGLDPETLLLAYFSHGMGPHYDGEHLLAEVLRRLDQSRPGASRRPARPVSRLANGLRSLARRLQVPIALRRRAARILGLDYGRAIPAQAFFQVPNNSVVGGVRLNLAGREPQGVVPPGEAERMLAMLERELLALVNEATGRPAVLKITRAEDFYTRTPEDRMPDLFVEWDRSAPMESLTSPTIGRVQIPYTLWRTGDHKPEGLLLARGPGFAAGSQLAPVAVEDLGPSIAARFGVRLDDVDGVVAPGLADGALSPGSAPAPSTAAARR